MNKTDKPAESVRLGTRGAATSSVAIILAFILMIISTFFSWWGPKAGLPAEEISRSAVSEDVDDQNWVDALFEDGEVIKNEAGKHVAEGGSEFDSDKTEYAEYKEKTVGDVYVPSVDTGEPNEVQPTAGTITAGRWNDNENYSDFVIKVGEWSEYTEKRTLYPLSRYHVNVPGAVNACVALVDEDGNALSKAVTDVNGDAYLYYDRFSPNKGEKPYKIGVSSGDAVAEHVITGDEGETVVIECASSKTVTKLDVLLMIDVTGSMGDELMYLQTEIKDVIERVSASKGNLDIRLSVNFYRDHGDDYIVSFNPFTDNIDECVKTMLGEYASGGGDYPEAVDEAMLNAVCEHAWDEDAVKVMFIVLDAPPHDESERQGTNANIAKAVSRAAESGIRIVPITASGVDTDTEFVMRSSAAMTGGIYTFITNDSGIGYDHKEAEVGQHDVEKLNDLMVDVISGYVIAKADK